MCGLLAPCDIGTDPCTAEWNCVCEVNKPGWLNGAITQCCRNCANPALPTPTDASGVCMTIPSTADYVGKLDGTGGGRYCLGRGMDKVTFFGLHTAGKLITQLQRGASTYNVSFVAAAQARGTGTGCRKAYMSSARPV